MPAGGSTKLNLPSTFRPAMPGCGSTTIARVFEKKTYLTTHTETETKNMTHCLVDIVIEDRMAPALDRSHLKVREMRARLCCNDTSVHGVVFDPIQYHGRKTLGSEFDQLGLLRLVTGQDCNRDFWALHEYASHPCGFNGERDVLWIGEHDIHNINASFESGGRVRRAKLGDHPLQ